MYSFLIDYNLLKHFSTKKKTKKKLYPFSQPHMTAEINREISVSRFK